ncbi:MAG: tetratricopeptide repeat protein [Terracidiphilus sp.]
MKRSIWFALVLLGCMATGPHLVAQTTSNGNGAGQAQTKPSGQQPGQPQSGQQQGQPAGANAFPEDTNSIPVLPVKTATGGGDGGGSDSGVGYSHLALPSEDMDPARSPDDPEVTPGTSDSNFSSSLTGMDRVLPAPDDDSNKPDQKRKLAVKEPTHKEAASKDIEVGGYYLERKNWKAAESRFESAMVLDPDNPDVFWGLAESAKHLGNFADAKKYYQTVVDYDPDSKHGKEAKKALKEPEVANAVAAAPVGETPKQ